MKLPFAGLIFDCDGTLADTMPAHYQSWCRTLERYGLEFAEERFYAWGGRPTEEIIVQLADEAGVVVDVAQVAHEKEQDYLASLEAIKPIEPVVAFARRMQGVVPMAVASGGAGWIVDKTLRQIGVRDWFVGLATSDVVARPKPEPDVYVEGARLAGVSPSQCWAFEDTDLGVEGVRRAGMTVVDVRRLLRGEETPLSNLLI
jgi:beta-phosphoglucomutase-like phosphatase (HAD superfamily)